MTEISLIVTLNKQFNSTQLKGIQIMSGPVWTQGCKARIGSPYPHTRRKRRNGTVSRNKRKKINWPGIGALTGTLKNLRNVYSVGAQS